MKKTIHLQAHSDSHRNLFYSSFFIESLLLEVPGTKYFEIGVRCQMHVIFAVLVMNIFEHHSYGYAMPYIFQKHLEDIFE